MSTPDGRALALTWDPDHYGGPDSWGWQIALQTAVVHEARLGHLAAAQQLLDQFADWVELRLGYVALVVALAGAPDDATAVARQVVTEVDRVGNLLFRSELVLSLAIALHRRGNHARAFTYLETLRRAPMFAPVFYDLRRDYAQRARDRLDDDTAAQAREQASRLTVEAILDTELRAGASGAGTHAAVGRRPLALPSH